MSWPLYDEEKTKEDIIELPIQINGKVRGTVDVNRDASKEDIWEKIKENETIFKFIEGKEIIKEIFVKDKIFNIVIK